MRNRVGIKSRRVSPASPLHFIRFCRWSAATCAFALCTVATLPTYAQDAKPVGQRFDKQIHSLVSSLSPSVVTVQAVIENATPISLEKSLGSAQSLLLKNIPAIVIDTGGYLMCAETAVPDGDSMFISIDGRDYVVRRIGADYRSGLALLRVEGISLPPVEFSSESSSAGAVALFMASPEPRRVEPLIAIAAGSSPMEGYLEFNGPAGSGVAGGAFFDMSGRLLAVALGAIDGGATDRIFAAPVSRIAPIVSRLRCCGDRPAGYLGVKVADTEIRGIDLGQVSPAGASHTIFAAEGSNLARRASRAVMGALLTHVEPGSPADRSGLRVGDVIYRYDDTPVVSAAVLKDYVLGCAPDSVIEFSFLRGLEKLRRSVRIGSAPAANRFQIAGGNAMRDRFEFNGETNLIDSLMRTIKRLEYRVRTLEEQRRN